MSNNLQKLNKKELLKIIGKMKKTELINIINIKQNGGSNSSTNVPSSSLTSTINLTLGSANSDSFTGQLAELIIYSGSLSTYDLLRVERYLAKKWATQTNSSCKLWADCSDFSTLKQNSDGTGAVTSSGNPIGYILDKSGNGNHLIQPTASSKPFVDTSVPIIRAVLVLAIRDTFHGAYCRLGSS
jgi:hypothetical protein